MARRDLSGAVDFSVLERMTGGDDAITDEVLGLFGQQAAMWSPMLDVREEGWRDAVHTIRGAASGIGADALAQACQTAEGAGQGRGPAAAGPGAGSAGGRAGRRGGVPARADVAEFEGLKEPLHHFAVPLPASGEETASPASGPRR
jgi:hypothetical protein